MEQTVINDYFPVLRRHGSPFCYKCKVKFISNYHKQFHGLCRFSDGPPFFSFENLTGEIFLEILSYLNFQDFVKFIYAAPKVMTSHGFEWIWKRKTEARFFRLRPKYNVGSRCSRELMRKIKKINKRLK